MNVVMTVVVRWPAKQAEPFGFALIFWLRLLHQGKRWNNNNQVKNTKRKNCYYSNASLRQVQDKLAQHDKAREARAVSSQLDLVNVNKQYGLLKKLENKQNKEHN
jgi:hypothetical protein